MLAWSFADAMTCVCVLRCVSALNRLTWSHGPRLAGLPVRMVRCPVHLIDQADQVAGPRTGVIARVAGDQEGLSFHDFGGMGRPHRRAGDSSCAETADLWSCSGAL